MKQPCLLKSLTALLLLLSMLVSCNGTGTVTTQNATDPQTPTTSSTGTTHSSAEPTPEPDRIGAHVERLTLAQDGESDYTLIFPLGTSGWKRELVVWFVDTFEHLTGARLYMRDDFEAEDEPDTLRTAKEIVIGSGTTREDLYTVDPDSYDSGYSVFVDRERLVIAADDEIGLWQAMCLFFSDAFGVDVTAELPEKGERDCVVESGYTVFRRIDNAAFFSLGAVSGQYKILVDGEDGMQVRMSYSLQSAIQSKTGERFELTTDPDDTTEERIVLVTDPALQNGDWRLEVEGVTLRISAGDYYGFTGAAEYLRSKAEHGSYSFLRDGLVLNENYRSTLSERTKSTEYAFAHAGDVRVMFHNVLFKTPLPAERNLLQAEMIGIYMPDVLGLQEFNVSKRSGAGEQDLTLLLAELGYKETIEPAVRNAFTTKETIPGTDQKGYGIGNAVLVNVNGESYRTFFNQTPLFYNTNTTLYLDGGYYWYRNQRDAENIDNCTGEDCGSKSLTWGLFEDKATGGRYLVLNTHMCTRSGGVRTAQGREVLALIEELRAQYDVPIFLGGDMNCSVTSDSCKVFCEEGGMKDLCVEELARLHTAKIGTMLASPTERIEPLTGKQSVFKGGNASISNTGGVDHILVTDLAGVTVEVYGGVVDEYAAAGSDHVPLFTDFSFSS